MVQPEGTFTYTNVHLFLLTNRPAQIIHVSVCSIWSRRPTLRFLFLPVERERSRCEGNWYGPRPRREIYPRHQREGGYRVWEVGLASRAQVSPSASDRARVVLTNVPQAEHPHGRHVPSGKNLRRG